MKIGILTFHFCDNYGAVVQTYALQTYLRRLGHDVEIIDYQPDYMTSGGGFRLPTSRRNLKINAQVLFMKLMNLRARFGQSLLTGKFAEFRRQHLKLSAGKAANFKALGKLPPYDAYVCGSDQIWNPPLRAGVDPAYYAAFAPAGARRIAYAASFGRTDIEPEYQPEMAALLRQMHHLGVREEQGAAFAQQLSGKEVFWSPDPTMLLEDYPSVAVPPRMDDYLFTYVLCGGELIDEVQQQVAKELAIPSYTPQVVQQHWKIAATPVCLGPLEWVGHIQQARFVVTNSFHGTVFCILLKKPFISVVLPGRKQAINNRLISVLKRMGLEQRLVDRCDPAAVASLIHAPIDWEKTHGLLNQWRSEAQAFWRQALGELPADRGQIPPRP